MAILIMFSAHAFGETLYTGTFGFYQFYEGYSKEDYGRDKSGSNFIFTLLHYPEELPFGWFVKSTLGMTSSGLEWKGDDVRTLNTYSTMDVQISTGPSYKISLSNVTHIPISLGVILSHYGEESGYRYDFWDNNENGFLRAFNLGVGADAGILIIPNKRFTIVNGINITYDFMRWEKGIMEETYRTVNSGRFQFVNYNALKISLYTGIGLRFRN